MTSITTWPIHGGIHPPEHKRLSNQTPIQHPPLPKRLILPLTQHTGAPAKPCVQVGETVLKGQKIAEACGVISLNLHAPTSGIIEAIGPQPYPHVSGMTVPALVIQCDGEDRWTDDLEPVTNFRQLTPQALCERIAHAGINGLGGGGFPTASKLAARPEQKIHTLIVNGTECEPYITADDRLMRERAEALITGIEILQHMLTPDVILIGIEDNKPEAAAAVRNALGERPWGLGVFPTRYPSGGERQLIQILTGREVPSGRLPADIGIMCQNVGTCVAVHDAIIYGKPLISRITTLTGQALARPGNIEALIGTPIQFLLDWAGLYPEQLERLIMGGPMMGFTLPDPSAPVIKTTNCLLAATAEEFPSPPPARPCIRCGECAHVCPARLLPQQLHFYALGENYGQLQHQNLFDCIECGACAYVCPSSIPLVQYFRRAKVEIRTLDRKHQQAEHARMRFEQRQARLRKAEEQKEAERKARAERAAAAKAAHDTAPSTNGADEQLKKLKIDASMARVALSKAEKQLAQHGTPKLEAQVVQLRTAAEQAQQALQRAQTTGSKTPSSASPEEGAKNLKIEAAMLKAQIRKAEKIADSSAAARTQLQQWQQALSKLETQLASTSQATPKKVMDESLKKAKVALAQQRVALKKAEKAGASAAEIDNLRQSVTVAEQQLHQAEAHSNRPLPQHQRKDKQPMDEVHRQRKTELAFARAELRKLERDPNTPAEALDRAQARLATAEQALADH